MNNKNTMQVTRSLAMSSMVIGEMICIAGDDIGKDIVLDSDRMVSVGRDAAVCDYVLTSPVISRKHLDVKYVGSLGRYLLIDQSSNGTFQANGERMQKGKEYYLSSGDMVMLGDKNQVYRFR